MRNTWKLIFVFVTFCDLADASIGVEEDNKTIPIPRADLSLAMYKDTIVGSDVLLMPVFPRHSIYLYPVYCNADAMQYYGVGKVKTMEEVDHTYALKAAKNLREARAINYLIITAHGAAGQLAVEYSILEQAQEISYGISPDFKGRGIATAASQTAMRSYKGYFYATVHPQNTGSVAVLKKLGFKRNESRVNVTQYNSIRDYYLFKEQ